MHMETSARACKRNKKSAEKEVAENDVIVVSFFKAKKVPSLMWRECARDHFCRGIPRKSGVSFLAYLGGSLLCKQCGGMMTVASEKRILLHTERD